VTAALRVQWAAFLLGSVGLTLGTLAGAAPSRGIQLAVLVALVSLAGLPHGALDPLVAHRKRLFRSPAGLALFLAVYVVLALAALGAWALAPGLAWGVFLAVSAWHFSGDWDGLLHPLFRLGGGLSVVSLPALAHAREVERIFSVLVPSGAAADLVALLAMVAPLALAGLAAGALSVVRTDPRTAAELVALAAGGLVLPPLVFFAVYFCALHSPRHLIRAARGLPPRLALGTGVAFTALAVAAGAAAWSLWPGGSIETGLLRVTFIGLAALAIPHMVLIEYARRPQPEPAAG
jgi:Brp/Blh family beta-carotene 15,15'-monooxygenase